MKFKDFKKELRKEQYAIPNLLPKIESLAYKKQFNASTKDSIVTKKIKNKLLLKFCSVFIIIIMILAVIIISVNTSSRIRINKTLIKEVSTVDSQTNLSSILEMTNSYDDKYVSTFGNINCNKNMLKDSMPNTSIIDKNQNSSSQSKTDKDQTSEDPATPTDDSINNQTNNQVNGVDEPDIVKFDGKYLYYVYKETISIYQFENDTFEYLMNINSLKLINDDSSLNNNIQHNTKYLIWNYQYLSDGYIYTSVRIFNKNEAFKEEKKYIVSGKIIDTRLTDNNYFLITQMQIRDVTVKPNFTIDNSYKEIDYKDIMYISNTSNQGFTIISMIDLNDNLKITNTAQLGASAWNVVYASKENLYLASSIYNGLRSKIETTIYKYQISNNCILFNGFINNDGIITDQYSIDEYKNYLRVAYVDNTNKNPLKYNSIVIYDLDKIDKETLKIPQIGILNEGLGKKYQSIKAVRFNGEYASVVTYYNHDPLYSIDLTNPTAPKIISEYEAPGYSIYLHTFNNKYSLGIGYDDTINPKFSLYQTVDGITTQIGSDLLINNDQIDFRYNYIYPRELMTNNEAMVVAIPVKVYKKIDFSYKEIDSILVLKVNLTDLINPIQVLKVIDVSEFKDSFTYKEASDIINRMVIVKKTNLYYVACSPRGILVYDNDFELLYEVLVK